MSSPLDTIKELNDTIDTISEHNKDLQQQNHELTVYYYVMIGVFIITAVMASVFYNQRNDKDVQIEGLNNQMEWTVKEYNKLNHKHKKSSDELFWCKHVNGELIEKCDPSTVNRVIKATPLPERK